MLVYFDLCVLNRPFDDQSQPRIWIESQAIQILMQAVQEDRVKLVGSSALDMELARCPDAERKQFVESWLQTVSDYQPITEPVAKRAGELQSFGLRPLDCLHLACAEIAGARWFVTCDDDILKKYAGPLLVLDPPSAVRMLQEHRP